MTKRKLKIFQIKMYLKKKMKNI